MVGWLCFTSLRQRGHLETAPSLLSLAEDVKLGFYTVPTGNRTPGRRVAVHYTTSLKETVIVTLEQNNQTIHTSQCETHCL